MCTKIIIILRYFLALRNVTIEKLDIYKQNGVILYILHRDVNVFIFLKNERFVMKTTFFQKVRFLKMVVFKTIVLNYDRFSKRSFL